MQSAPQKIDYSRCPVWWWRVVLLVVTDEGRRDHLTFVRAADWEEAKRRAVVLSRDVKRSCVAVVSPMLNRSGLSRGAHEFAGYLDE